MLVDTSVWVNHFRRGEPALGALLEGGDVQCHAFVIGELACGSLSRRSEILALLKALPRVPTCGDDEALAFVERHHLMGRGIGWIDAHLLASAVLARSLL